MERRRASADGLSSERDRGVVTAWDELGRSWCFISQREKGCVCLFLPAAELRTTELPLELRYLLGSAHKYTYIGCLQVLKNSSNALH